MIILQRQKTSAVFSPLIRGSWLVCERFISLVFAFFRATFLTSVPDHSPSYCAFVSVPSDNKLSNKWTTWHRQLAKLRTVCFVSRHRHPAHALTSQVIKWLPGIPKTRLKSIFRAKWYTRFYYIFTYIIVALRSFNSLNSFFDQRPFVLIFDLKHLFARRSNTRLCHDTSNSSITIIIKLEFRIRRRNDHFLRYE